MFRFMTLVPAILGVRLIGRGDSAVEKGRLDLKSKRSSDSAPKGVDRVAMLALLSTNGIRLRIVAQGFHNNDNRARITDRWSPKTWTE
jgi:hypothetical protein